MSRNKDNAPVFHFVNCNMLKTDKHYYRLLSWSSAFHHENPKNTCYTYRCYQLKEVYDKIRFMYLKIKQIIAYCVSCRLFIQVICTRSLYYIDCALSTNFHICTGTHLFFYFRTTKHQQRKCISFVFSHISEYNV